MLRRDEGQAVIAGVAISFVVLALITTLLGSAIHTNDVSVGDRSRSQGVQSAEAAVSYVVDGLTRAVCVPDVGMTSPSSITVGGATVGQFQAIVRLPTEAGLLSPTAWDPNQPTAAGCLSPPATQDRVITAWGYGPHADSARKVLRKVQAYVQVAPLSGFRFACYAGGTAPDGVLTIRNNMIVNGNCFARTISETHNNLTENGTLVTPGSVTTKNNAIYNGNIWAGGDIVVGNNTTVTGYVTSAGGSVHLNQNARILGNLTAATTTTLDNNASVSGSMCPPSPDTPGCPTNPPPALTMPVLACASTDFACWATIFPGMASLSSAEMSAWLAANKANLTGSFYVNDSSTTDFTGGGTITGPFTIITRGKIELSRDLVTPSASIPPAACTPAGGPQTCIVTLVSTSAASDAIRIRAPRFTANPATISLLVYTSGTMLADAGANPVSWHGVLYGGNLDITSNGLSVTQSQDLIDHAPGIVDWAVSASAQYAVVNKGWQELAPIPPS